MLFWAAAGAVFWLAEAAVASIGETVEFGAAAAFWKVTPFRTLLAGLGVYVALYVAAGLAFESAETLAGKRRAVAEEAVRRVGWCIFFTVALVGSIALQSDFLPAPATAGVVLKDLAWHAGLLAIAAICAVAAMLIARGSTFSRGVAAMAFLAVWATAGYRGFRDTFGIVFSSSGYLAFAFVGMSIAVIFLAGGRMKSRGGRRLDYAAKGTAIVIGAVCIMAWAASLRASAPRVEETAKNAPRPNILLIVLDTVRGDHLSCYGYPRNTTPAIDRLASEGVLFERVMSVSHWTLPSHASMFTGQFPSEHLATGKHLYLESDYPTMAQILFRIGYQTACFSANPAVSSLSGLDRGFEHFEVVDREERSGRFKLAWKRWWKYICEINRRTFRVGLSRKRSERGYQGPFPPASLMVETVMEWWGTSRDRARPFFVFINLMDAHYPYTTPAHNRLDEFFADPGEYRRAFGVNQSQWEYYSGKVKMTAEDFGLLKKFYDGQIRYMDEQLLRLFKHLERSGEWTDTVVVVTSDHGEYFGERGLMEHIFPCGWPSLHVPLVIRGLPRYENGARVEATVQNIDILPTLAEMLQIEWPGREELPGRSLLHPAPERVGYAESYPNTDVLNFLRRYSESAARRFDRKAQAILSGGYEYLWTDNGESGLYYLPEDPSEKHNLINKFPELVEGLKAEALRRAERSDGAPSGATARKFRASTRETLKTLGYVR